VNAASTGMTGAEAGGDELVPAKLDRARTALDRARRHLNT